MSKKKALGTDPLSWIKSTADEQGVGQSEAETATQRDAWSAADALPEKTEAEDVEEGALGRPAPKFESFGVKLTVRLSDEQLEYLAALERRIMKSRSPGNRAERITKNSIIRAAVNALAKLEIDASEIGSEADFESRVAAAAREAYRRP